MRARVLRLVLTVVAVGALAAGVVAVHTTTGAGAVASGGPTCWDWTPPDQ